MKTMSAAKKLLPLNPLFDKELLRVFADAVLMTMATLADTDVKVGKPLLEARFVDRSELVGVISLVAGPLQGTLVLSFGKASLQTLAERTDGDAADAVYELTQAIFDTAKSVFSQMDYDFENAAPTVLRGNFIATKSHPGPALVVPFEFADGGTFYLKITVP
jgi:chemotaxis protein CheX